MSRLLRIDQFIYASCQKQMRRLIRNPIVIVLVALVLLAPLFEFFDRSGDMEQGNDFVLALLCAVTAASLFLLCRRVVSFLLRSFRETTGSPTAGKSVASRTIEVTASPPESLLLFGSLRI
jgi:hypothetical protein